jgi:hypothetical protein
MAMENSPFNPIYKCSPAINLHLVRGFPSDPSRFMTPEATSSFHSPKSTNSWSLNPAFPMVPLWVPQRQACSENTRSSRSWRPAAFEARCPCHGDGRPGNAGILPNNGELTKNKMTSKNGEQKMGFKQQNRRFEHKWCSNRLKGTSAANHVSSSPMGTLSGWWATCSRLTAR